MQDLNVKSTTYEDGVIRQFSIMAVVWGVVGMLVGVVIAAQLVWPELNLGLPWTSFGRLRPLHTNAVIFAFGGCTLFATSYYVVQRTCQTKLFMPKLASFTFWAWQLVILSAAVSLPLGFTQGKEYAELEWPIDLLIAVTWVCYAVVFFGTVGTRKVKHIYVANWFFGAFIITVALLHIVNSAAIPAEFMKSYSAYAGVQDAMVQWWYGHNAVGFFLTAGFLGIMYYFVPKQAGRPVYSYSLSIVHFWALIFTYMWAGPHHLHYTALPDWTQSLGMAFSLVLLAPSWGGMIAAERGNLVKAYVVLSPEFVSQRAAAQDVQHFESRLIEDLQRHVRGLLAPYEYPKEIEFIEQLPMTTTGKVQRRFLRLQEEERTRQKTKM